MSGLSGRGNDIETGGRPQGYSSVSSISNSPKGVGISTGGQVRFQSLSHTIGITGVKVLPGNAFRKYLMIQNQSGNDIFIGFGVKVDNRGVNGYRLSGGGFIELDQVVSTDQIFIASVNSGATVLVIEGTPSDR